MSRTVFIRLLSFVLLSSLAACNVIGGGEVATNENEAAAEPTVALPTAAPTAEAVAVEEEMAEEMEEEAAADAGEETAGEETMAEEEPAAEDTASDLPDTLNLDDTDLYLQPVETNYRFEFVFNSAVTTVDGEEVVSNVTGVGARTIDPEAATYQIILEGGPAVELGGQTFESTVIEGNNYFSTPGLGCVVLGENEETDNPYDVFLDTGGFFDGEVERVLPNQTINGVDARVYQVERENIDTFAVTELTEATLYVAEEGGYVVRAVISGRGTNNLLIGDETTEGEIYYEINFTPTTEPIDITIPAACEGLSTAAGEGEDNFPMLDDATVTMATAEMSMYNTGNDIATTAAFYEEQMTAAGWTLDSQLGDNNVGLQQTFTRDGETVLVTISIDSATGDTLVAIITQ